MALPTYYSIGTVSVGAGGTTVTGVGTVWTGVIHEGDLFTDPATGTFSRVTADATSNTSLSINPWPGSALTGADYEVLITPDTARMQERTRIVLERLGELQQLGIQPNAFGPLSERDTYDNDPSGFIYLSIDDPWTLYIKESDASGDWDAGQPMEGAPGPAGPAGPPGADSTVPGPANELTIGTVTGGAIADATITGTSPDQVLNLVLPQGAPGTDGDDGDNGWSPVFAVASDSARRVLQVSDWTGGEGTEPASGLYVGPTGLTATIGDAVDIRGPQGASGSGSGDMEASVYDPHNIDADAFDRANHTGTQAASTITGLADVATSGDYADLTGKPTLGTAASKNTGTASGNVPVLDGSGLLDTTVLPAIAITDVFTVANQAAMLALTAQKGDIAIRTDLNKSFALSTNSPSTLADWKELLTPTDAVLSVAGLTGAISIAALVAAITALRYDQEDQTISGGARVTTKDLGNLSGASITPDPGDRPIQKVTNNGAGSILPGSNEGQYTLEVVNASGAGTITLTGWTTKGDSFDTTSTSKFVCSCLVTSDIKLMTIVKVV